MRDICWFRGTAGHLMKMRDCPSECGPRRQTHFGKNLLRINLKSVLFSVAVYTPNSDPIRFNKKAKKWGGHFLCGPHQAEKWGGRVPPVPHRSTPVVFMHTHAFIYTCVKVRMHAYIIHTYTYIHTYIHTYIYVTKNAIFFRDNVAYNVLTGSTAVVWYSYIDFRWHCWRPATLHLCDCLRSKVVENIYCSHLPSMLVVRHFLVGVYFLGEGLSDRWGHDSLGL